jgi:hypothetical protein
MSSAWHILLALFFVFLVTFIIFPGSFFDTKLSFMNGMESEQTWFILIIIIIFNICDTIGRTLGGKIMLNTRIVILLSILRVIFIGSTAGIAI